MKKLYSLPIAGIIALSSLFLLACEEPAQAVDVGAAAPSFSLETYDGTKVSTEDLKDKTLVLEWFNAGCPYVVKHYKNGHMQALQKEWSEKGVVWLTINSTAKDHQDYLDTEAAAKTKTEWKMEHTTFLPDADGRVGKLFGAKTTPHMYVIQNGVLRYQGAIDDNDDAYANPSESKNYLALALEELAAGKEVTKSESKPYGCSVKYAD